MKTLIINFHIDPPELKLSGLSFKALKGTDAGRLLFRDDCQCYALEYNHHLNRNTARIESSFLIARLKEIHSRIPFDKIKIEGYYELTGDELIKKINEQFE